MNKDLPIYKAVVNDDDETGVNFVSLVGEPAIEVNWQAFSKNPNLIKDLSFQVSMEQFQATDKQKLAGPLMIPDLPIYRGDYYVVFDAETIEKMAEKFNRTLKASNINFQHNKNITVSGYVAENWIVGEKDKSETFGFDLPVGTWFGIIKVDDAEFWNDAVKNKSVMGFSIEGLFGMNKINNTEMKKENKFSVKSVKLAEIVFADGSALVTSTDVPAVGDEIFSYDADGNTVAAADGDYTLEDGTIYRVADGKIAEIIAPEAASAKAEEKMALTPEDTQAILDQVMAAVMPMFEEYKGHIALLEERVAALEGTTTEAASKTEEMSKKIEEFSMLPGAASKTDAVKLDLSKNVSMVDLLSSIGKMKSTETKK